MNNQPQNRVSKRGSFPIAGFRWLTFGFILFLALIIFWADRGSLPAPIVALYAFPEGDKVGHFVLYGLLSSLLVLSFPKFQIKILERCIPAGLMISLAIALVEEVSQAFFQTRSASLFDLASSWLGALLFTWIAVRVSKSPPARNPSPDDRRSV